MLLTSWVNQCLFPTSQQCPSRDSMMFYGRTPRKTTSLVYDIWIPMCWYVGESKSKGALFFSLLIRTFVQKWKKLVLCSLPQWLFIWKYLCIHWIQVLLFSGEYHCWSSNWHSQFHWIVHWDFDYSMQNETAFAKDIALHLRNQEPDCWMCYREVGAGDWMAVRQIRQLYLRFLGECSSCFKKGKMATPPSLLAVFLCKVLSMKFLKHPFPRWKKLAVFVNSDTTC